MNQFSIILLCSFGFSLGLLKFCPNNEPVGDICHSRSYGACNGTSICTWISSDTYCCDLSRSPCNETGLHSFPRNIKNAVDFKWIDGIENKEDYYPQIINTNGITESIACPTPAPFIFSSVKNSTLVYDVGTEFRKCKSHEDCSDDEFCGQTYNPSYCNRTNSEDFMKNSCMDKSNNGTPMSFCFVAPRFADNTNIKVVKGTVVDLIGCNTHRDCDDASSFCNLAMPMKKSTNGTIVEFRGTCIQIACQNTGTETILGQLGKGQEPCGSGNATCDEMSVCIEVPVQTDSHMSICCQAEADVSTVSALLGLGSTVSPLVSEGPGNNNGSEPEFLGSSAVAAADLSAVRTFCKPRVTAILATVYSFVVLFHAIVGGYIGIFYTITWKKTTKGTNVAKIVEDTGDAEVRTRRAEEAAAEMDREILELQGEICRDPAAHG